MKKSMYKSTLDTLTKLCVTIAKTTVCSTTRFGVYQPEKDYKVYKQMKQNNLVK